MPDAWGRECKLGWKYNKCLERFTPVEENLQNIICEANNEWEYNADSSSLNSIVNHVCLLLSE